MDAVDVRCCDDTESEAEYSDDSSDDPSYEVLEETLSDFSNLSIKKKPKIRMVKGKDETLGEDSGAIETVVLELDEQSQKSYEAVQNLIGVGQVEKLKVEQCKIYLRKHGLRLSGTKETLIQRIKEHVDIVNGGGEKKYPASSFVVNCKGDACMGDVVMFEQNVYEMYNIVSRSASGPPCGTRVVAGRIVKESYGASKQQHTFTIEVLWSKGEKPLPPLHQLLIKGRNLYKLKTMRQRWDNEEERQRILSEKHNRGGIARLNREERLQRKEMRKMKIQARVARNEHPIREHGEQKRGTLQPLNSNSNTFPRHQHTSLHFSNVSSSHVTDHCMLHQPQGFPYHGYPGYSQCYNAQNWQNTNVVSSHVTDHRMLHQPQGFPDHGYPGYSQSYNAQNWQNTNIARNLPVPQHSRQNQVCRHYLQGRCYYGDRCKYSHDTLGHRV